MSIEGNVKLALTTIVERVVKEIRERGWQDPCFAAVVPGDQVAFDYCGNDTCGGGMVWARLVSVVPVTNELTAGGLPCVSGINATIEVGMVRSAPWPETDAGGNILSLPTGGDQLHAAELQMDEMGLMERVLVCAPLGSGRVTLGDYAPIGPDGGCVGGRWTATIPVE